jgi:alkanesulfonate monooxygenase SsuD/methylene tetrahydromethanopterin reductase-like flavin-dependent oxidoreductase (luciferase family)
VNSPTPISRIPIMIGGGGERKTLRMVAQYADESNLGSCPITDVPRKLDALAGHCERLGRDRSEIAVTNMVACCVAPTMEQAEAELRATAAAKGWSGEIVELAKAVLVFGDPDTVGEHLSEHMATGIDGLTLSLAANGHVPERVSLLAEVANAAMG